MADYRDVVIVGGGVIGCSIGYYLARAGVKATIVEKDFLGAHASSIAAGMLAPLTESEKAGPELELGLASLRMFPGLSRELKEEGGIDIEYAPSGSLTLARTQGEEELLKERVAWQRERGLDVRWLEVGEVLHFEPSLDYNVRGAAYAPDEGHVRSSRLVQAFAQAGARRGLGFMLGSQVHVLLKDGSRVKGVGLHDRQVFAGHVVLASGPWTAQLGEGLGARLPVFPLRGQLMSLYQVPTPIRHIVFVPGWGYLVPREDGTVTVGATVERAGFDARVTAWGMAYLLNSVASAVPSLSQATFAGTWAGLRPWPEDGLPLLGPVPGWEGVSVASGHYRNGILMAPITGKLMAELILEGHTSIPLEPFSPARFHKPE